MFEALLGTAADAGTVVMRAVVAVVAAVAGVFVELNGLQTLGTGDQLVGTWMTAVGCLLLVVCVVLARDLVSGVSRSAT